MKHFRFRVSSLVRTLRNCRKSYERTRFKRIVEDGLKRNGLVFDKGYFVRTDKNCIIPEYILNPSLDGKILYFANKIDCCQFADYFVCGDGGGKRYDILNVEICRVAEDGSISSVGIEEKLSQVRIS